MKRLTYEGYQEVKIISPKTGKPTRRYVRPGVTPTYENSISLRQFQTQAHGGVSFERRKKAEVAEKKEIEPTPPKQKKPGILESLPGFKRNKDGSYTDTEGTTISKYEASRIRDGKLTIDEAVHKYRKIDLSLPGEQRFQDAGWNGYVFKNIEHAKNFAKDPRWKNYKMFPKIQGKAKLYYEGEERNANTWRGVTTSSYRTYSKDAYWEYVLDEEIGKMFKEGKYTLIVLYFKESR